jgi:hypothetical protein
MELCQNACNEMDENHDFGTICICITLIENTFEMSRHIQQGQPLLLHYFLWSRCPHGGGAGALNYSNVTAVENCMACI